MRTYYECITEESVVIIAMYIYVKHNNKGTIDNQLEPRLKAREYFNSPYLLYLEL